MIDSLSDIIQKHIASQFESIMIEKIDATIAEIKNHLNEEFKKAENDIKVFEQNVKNDVRKKAQDLTVELLRRNNVNGISVEVKI